MRRTFLEPSQPGLATTPRTAAIDDPMSREPSAAFLRAAVIALVAGALAFIAVIALVAPDQTRRMLGPVLAVLVGAGAWVLLARGRPHAAVALMAGGCWAVITGISVFNGGVRTPIVVAYPVSIMMVGWLIGPRPAVVAAALSTAAVIGFGVAEALGWLPVAPATPPAMHVVVQVMVFTLATILVTYLVRSYQDRLEEMQRLGTDLARRGAELEANRAELNRAQSVAQVGSWVYDIGRDRMWLSAETCRIFGLPEGTLGNREHYLARTHAADRAAVDAAWQAALRGAGFDHEHRIVVGAATRWVRQKAEFELAPDGTALRAVGVTQDVSQRKQAEAEVQATRSRLQATLDAIPDLLFELDAEGRILHHHAHRENLLAAPPEAFIGRRFDDVLPPDAARTCGRALQEAARNGWSGGAQYMLPLAQGERWFELSVSRMTQADERQGHFIAIARDITERKGAESQLELYASVFTHAREGIMITAADGNIIDVNDAFTRITGYGRDEVLGRNPRMFNSGRHDNEFYATMWRSLHDKGHWFGEIWNRRKDGEVYAQMQTVSAVRGADGGARHYVALFSDISALKAHERQLERIAHYDVLTGLPNRALLADRLHLAMAQAQRRSQLLAVAFLDLDGFKAINDHHGHDAGDRLLVALAARMRQALREGDTLARIGGDEFVAVLADLDDIEASPPLLTRLLEAVAQPVGLDDGSLQVTASLGVTFHPQPDPVDADQLLRQADQAMYQAKLAGKNRFHVFDPEQDRGVRGRHESLEQVRAALSAGEFVLLFQPKVNMRTGSVVGAEALLRWRHPVRGLLPPGDFLPVVEDHALAVDVGDWVIATALDQQARWREAGLDLPVSVNVSARHLQEPDFVARLGRHLAAHPRLRPGDLTLEVLETTALEDLDQSARIIESCRRMQVSFALDDFGTGYSSLTYLKRLGMAQLKIDQSFVRDMLEDPDDLAILEGVLGLAAAFRREVVAEGVERIEQGVLLLQLGCEVAQGYAIARPMPGAELPDWVARWRPDPAWLGRPTISRDDLPLLVAGVEHRAWIKGLIGHLGGERLQPPPLDLLECRFGHWLAGHARERFAARPELRRIEDLHLKVHGLAALMCGLHDDGHREQALARLDDLLSISAALDDQLKRLASASRA